MEMACLSKKMERSIRKKMEKELVITAVDWLNEREIGYYMESKNGLFANQYFLIKAVSVYGENSEENREKIRKIFQR